MLIEFKVTNYLSFKETTIFSMVASKDDSLPNNIIQSAQGTKFNLLKSAAIYGANASGKSNFIKSLRFVKSFVLSFISPSSEERQVNKPINVIPFKLDESCLSKPSEFEVTFLWEGVQYIYGFAVDKVKVHKEWFYSYPKKQPRMLFERDINKEEIFSFGPSWKGEKQSIVGMTRPNALFISVATQFANKLTKVVIDWFSEKLEFEFEEIFKELICDDKSTSSIKKIVNIFLGKADLGIIDFDIKREKIISPESINEPIINTKGNDDNYTVTLYHNGVNSLGEKIKIPFNLIEESEGTQKFFSLSGNWLHSLLAGQTLIIDELDVHLHPELTKWLIDMFCNIQSTKGAQLIFTTHDSNLLDQSLFRRDQIWFTEKKPDGATDLYSLWDIKIRKDENIRKGYLAGRYGAIPFLGDIEGWEEGMQEEVLKEENNQPESQND